MAIIGTFSSYTTARLAIYASQASLNVTGNNIANINTKGYTRQRMDLVSLYSTGAPKFANLYNTNIGYGVLTNGATQLRDPYLDIRYRDENCKLEQNSEWLDGLTQMSRILDEVGKGDDCFGVIEAQLGNLKDALQKLSNQESFREPDDLVRAEAKTLTQYFNQSAVELQTIWDNKREELDDAVDQVNKLLTDVRNLNEKIRTQALYNDKALELRDARNLALDELSKYLNINVEYSSERIDQFTEVERLTVTIADSKGPDGRPIKLVDGIYGGQISLPEKEPLMNPDYDPKAINAAKEVVRQQTEKDHPLSDWLDDAAWVAQQEAKLRPELEKTYSLDRAPWPERKGILERQEISKARAEAEKGFTKDMTKEQKEAAYAAAEAAGKANAQKRLQEEWQKDIDGKVTRSINSTAAAERQAIIDKAVSEKEAELVAAGGKYVKTKADPNANPPVAAEYTNNVEEAVSYANDKFLIRVEPLKDDRDRLMIDPYTVSKESEAVELGDNVLRGKLQAIREMLTEEGEYASSQDLGRTDEARLSDDPNAAIKRGIPYYQKALDSLARKIAGEFNDMNQMDPQTVYQMAENPVNVTDGKVDTTGGGTPEHPFLKSKDPAITLEDAAGKLVTRERVERNQEVLKDPNATAEAKKEANADMLACQQALQESGLKDPLYEFYDGGVLFSNNGNNNDPSEITAANISISIDWAEGPVRVLNTKQPDDYDKDGNVIKHSSRSDNILQMIERYDKQLDYFAQDIQPDAEQPKAMLQGSFREVFTSISAKLGGDQYTTNGVVTSYELMTLDLENDRQSVSGVDLNEEATSMMQFSKSYAAACKLLTTLDSMLDKLINGTI